MSQLFYSAAAIARAVGMTSVPQDHDWPSGE